MTASMFLRKEHSLVIGRVYSIESFGTADGPGIRMVIFLSGYPIRCPYRHNPGIWDPRGDTPMTAEDILNQYEWARPFYKKGDITTSDGEPLMQIDFVIEFFEKVEKRGIHTCLDTPGTTFNPGPQAITAHFDRFLVSVGLMLLDIRHINLEEHMKLCSQPQDNILTFTGYLEKRRIPVWIRHVVIPDIADRGEYLHRLGYYLGTLKSVKVLDVFPYHDMGKAKYHQFGIPYSSEDIIPLPPAKVVEA